MKRTSLIFLLLICVAGSADAAAKWHKSVQEARNAAAAKKQMIFVDLFADWCGWCHRFDREIVPSEVFQNATKNMVLLRVDTEDRGEGTRLSQQFGIQRLPSFLILNHDMTVVARLEGFAPADGFVKNMNIHLAEYDKFRKNLENESKLDAAAKLQLASQLLARQDLEGAEKRFRVLATDAKAPAATRNEALYLLAYSESQAGRKDAALGTVNQVLEKKPAGDLGERAMLLRAEILMQKRDFPAALAAYRKFKLAHPDSPHLRTVNAYIPQLEMVVGTNQN
ncbi:MAG TPA: thioredoxin family protein [Thermoanaerobaculia bacterium]|nr:thioredoxin family protein [Thermoanaerobaculia bacterium]